MTLIRHGTAGNAARDEDRALTREGRRDVAKVARCLLRGANRFDVVVSSPLVRAVQTAELIVAGLSHGGRVLVDPRLEPEGSPRELLGLLAELAPGRRVALVAHEPILSSFASLLLGRSLGRGLMKSEAMRIRLPQGLDHHGEHRWSIDPAAGKRKAIS